MKTEQGEWLFGDLYRRAGCEGTKTQPGGEEKIESKRQGRGFVMRGVMWEILHDCDVAIHICIFLSLSSMVTSDIKLCKLCLLSDVKYSLCARKLCVEL